MLCTERGSIEARPRKRSVKVVTIGSMESRCRRKSDHNESVERNGPRRRKSHRPDHFLRDPTVMTATAKVAE